MPEPLKDTIGLDIRDTALTAVELEPSKEGIKVKNYARLELEPGIIDEDAIVLNPEAFKKAVSKLLEEGHEGRMESKNVIISIPEEKTFSHYLNVPADDVSLRENVLEAARDYIPVELDEAAIDYRELYEQSTKKEIAFDFVAVQRSIIQPAIDALQDIGLRVVAIDVDKNSLMRASGYFEKGQKSSLLVQVNHERTLLTVKNTCGVSHTLTLNLGEKALFQRVQKELNTESFAQAKSLVNNHLTKPGTDEKAQKIQAYIDDFYNQIILRARELRKMVEAERCPEISQIFIVEMGIKWLTLKTVLKKEFAKSEVIDKFDSVKVGNEDQRHYFNAIGLALRAVLPEVHENEINLLPHTKKEEIRVSKVRPKLAILFGLVFIAIAIATIMLGVTTGKTYFYYLVSNKALQISEEQVKNPYLAQVAQATQQKAQMESQIKLITDNNIPATEVIQKLDDYNMNGIRMVNAAYQLDLDGNMNIGIRAKTLSREETEKFIVKLENERMFAEVNSPLSNLVGKGERFIQMDVILDKEELADEGIVSDEADGQSAEEPTEELPEGEITEEPIDTAETQDDAAETQNPASDEEGETPAEEPADTTEASNDSAETEEILPSSESQAETEEPTIES